MTHGAAEWTGGRQPPPRVLECRLQASRRCCPRSEKSKKFTLLPRQVLGRVQKHLSKHTMSITKKIIDGNFMHESLCIRSSSVCVRIWKRRSRSCAHRKTTARRITFTSIRSTATNCEMTRWYISSFAIFYTVVAGQIDRYGHRLHFSTVGFGVKSCPRCHRLRRGS